MRFFEVLTKKQHRQLLIELTRREIKQRYKQSVLGYVWVILNPLAQMVVMSFVFSYVFRPGNLGVPYPIFLFVALLPWSLFSQSMQMATNSLVENSGLLSKIYFPREVLILSAITAKIVDFFLALVIFIIMMISFKIPLTTNVFWVIPIFLIQVTLTYGITLLTAAANLFYRDIQYLLNLLLLVWMYLTPIMYPTEIFPAKFQWVFKVNPMAVLVNAYREAVLAGGMPNLVSLSIASFVSVILVIVGFKVFKKLEGQFADAV